MIKQVTMYTVVCDICGRDNGEDSEFSAWGTDEWARVDAEQNGFQVVDGKDVCGDCWTYNDDDELVILKEGEE